MNLDAKIKTLQLNIQKNILTQFADQFDIPNFNNTIAFDEKIGRGKMELFTFPEKLELYYFKFQLRLPVRMQSLNPEKSDWLLLNINLSQSKITKKVNSKEVDFQRHLPSGILFYTPNTKVESISFPSHPYEIILIRFHQSIFENYQLERMEFFLKTERAVLYEDLDAHLEMHLQKIIKNKTNKFLAHSELLQFLFKVFKKIQKRKLENNYENLHPADLKGLFLAAAQLRNPLTKELLKVENLAKTAGMGISKFKTRFKQVFGSPPIKYHQKIKMEYAQIQLRNHEKSVSEISYELGYSHPSKFTLAFKKHFDILPSKI